MADVYSRPYELDEETVNDLSYYVILDDPDWAECKKMSVDNFLEPERTDRQDADDTIEAACGLETDGTFAPDESSHYVRSVDFVAAGVSADLKNAISLLDAAVYALNNRLFMEIFFDFSSANLLAINSSPITIYAAMPGYVANVILPMGKLTFNTTQYDGRSEDLEFRINGIKVAHLPYELIEEAADAIYRGSGAVDVKLTPNVAITAQTNSLDYLNGDSTLRARLLMELVDENLSGSNPVNGCCNIPQTGEFVNGDLVANKLTIQHNLNTQYILGVAIKDNSGIVTNYPFTVGDAGGLNPNDYITVDLTAVAPIAGTWTYYFIAIQI